MDNLEKIDRLRRELAESVRVADDDAVRRAYQDLLRAGHSRKQIMEEVMSLATASQQRPRLITENSAGLRAPEEETKPTSIEPEIRMVERLAAQFPLARAQLTTEAAPPRPPEPVVGDKADDQEHRAPHFSRWRWTAMYAAVAMAALAAGAGGYVFFKDRGEGCRLASLLVFLPPQSRTP